MRHDTANKETCCYEAGAAKFACLEYTRTHAHSNPCKGSTGMSCMLAVCGWRITALDSPVCYTLRSLTMLTDAVYISHWCLHRLCSQYNPARCHGSRGQGQVEYIVGLLQCSIVCCIRLRQVYYDRRSAE